MASNHRHCSQCFYIFTLPHKESHENYIGYEDQVCSLQCEARLMRSNDTKLDHGYFSKAHYPPYVIEWRDWLESKSRGSKIDASDLTHPNSWIRNRAQYILNKKRG